MAVVSREELDKRLKNKTGFWKGIWLIIVIACRFIVSFGPKNWNLAKIATAERPSPALGATEKAEEVNVRILDRNNKTYE